MKILVTGAASFIGSKLMFMLAEHSDEVVQERQEPVKERSYGTYPQRI